MSCLGWEFANAVPKIEPRDLSRVLAFVILTTVEHAMLGSSVLPADASADIGTCCVGPGDS